MRLTATQHCMDRMVQRGITSSDIKRVLAKGTASSNWKGPDTNKKITHNNVTIVVDTLYHQIITGWRE